MFGFGKKARRRNEAEGLFKSTMMLMSDVATIAAHDPSRTGESLSSSDWWRDFAILVGKITEIADRHLAACKTADDRRHVAGQLLRGATVQAEESARHFRCGDEAALHISKAKEIAAGLIALRIMAEMMMDEEDAAANAYHMAEAVISDALEFLENGRIPSEELAEEMRRHMPKGEKP